ncbi:vitamin K epoxide reductase family protein [Bacteroides sp. 519]|uniref:vitamin K epoxide reductase family protein n=1 Tax=Bacteroides sp. 519 TaxID=2302937 RepID=UPI0013CF4671|nr:vitamin K epoxide reductase family protein [Bacteroides sp. 519]NDV57145.1 hypothetical protein [Bacteroides sp. 519]
MKNDSNLLTTILNELGVKHTKTFTTDYYEQHPHKNNLFGISQMLTDYEIENEGLRFADKASIVNELPTPLIAQVSNDFVVVRKIDTENVEYIWKQKKINVSIAEFLRVWSGVVLIAESDKCSVEPDYKNNRKVELWKQVGYHFLWAVIFLLISIAFIKLELWKQPGMCFAFLFNALGLYISYLLFLKQIHTHNEIADKVCSLFLKKGDCNDILDSSVAKLWGIISLSEVGLAYFSSNIIIIFFFPVLYPFAVLINLCALPFTLWSIWYQKFRARQWCPLCVIVQVIIWLLCVVNYISGLIVQPLITLENILLTGCIYALPLLMLKNIVPYIVGSREHKNVLRELNSMKANEEIFKMMLMSNKKHEVDKTNSNVLLGNPEANNLITIVTNPHCTPCARMHKQIVNLIKKAANDYCVQFVLTTFSKDKEDIHKLFIASYSQNDKSEFLVFLDNWYRYGQYNEDDFLKKNLFDNNNTDLTDELNRHKEFIERTGIRATPTILFNGYEMPLSKYGLNDLVLLKGISIL